MPAITTPTLRLELFFGVPLAKATASQSVIFSNTLGADENEEEAFLAEVRSLDGGAPRKAFGFYTTLGGEVESALFFGVPVKRINLHVSRHHIEVAEEIAKLDLKALKAGYAAAAAKTKHKAILKAAGQGKPRVLAILTAFH